jgi:propionate CoA-transferase
MDLLTKASLLKAVVTWSLTWGKNDSDYRPPVANPKFLSGKKAAALIPDGAVVMSTGMAACMRCRTQYFAIRERFEATGHPRNLTWVAPGGIGGRGRVPGTVEEVCRKGLVKRFIGGHLETIRALLALAERGEVELACVPQGLVARLALEQGRGNPSLLTPVGVGTFVDPRVGAGTQVVKGIGEQLVRVDGDQLRFALPPITVGIVMATGADEDGNLYVKHAPIVAENYEAATAAKRNGGVVIASVAEIVPKDESAIFLRADQVDAIIVNPRNEQSGPIPQLKYWPDFTVDGKGDIGVAAAKLKFINNILKLDPVRGPVENALARLTAQVFAEASHPGAHAIIGYGLPQEAGNLIREAGLAKDITFLIETGVYGGVPAPGFFFGMAMNPQKLIPSGEMFEFCMDHLDTTILGLLQADSDGNVNVSRKGPGPRNFIGPGGFIDLVTYAKNIVFVGQWMARAQMSVEGGRLSILKPGIPKFVEHVDEITFNGAEAVKKGQHVWYVTNVGVFRLTARGLELDRVVPGVDIRRDIVDGSPARIVVPEGDVPVVDASVLTGEGFTVAWKK